MEISDKVIKPDDSKVVGGNTASEGQFPYQISLRNRKNQHFCGGSIINEQWILTAAHCVDGETASSMMVVVGTNHLDHNGTQYDIAKVISHPSYNPLFTINDIALIQTNDTIQFNDRIDIVNLTDTYPQRGSTAILSGWGLTKYPDQSLPNELQFIELRIISNIICRIRLFGFPILSTHVCTLSGRGKGACQGDSGGPLVVNGTQVGIVSWGIPCARGRPDVFTSVVSYREWIMEQINSPI
ncbi:hypothetical protein RDWZM_003746 [Blomia tropicalis]|uniref:Peptidase S1 domain-containing protein n=1 Tax=Blomia tropicalis TaxID=40697 RepID=A0A9Q0RSW1_BLOTA|nr:hypothetical protein RDWZM_003746 [Blomia tropicalis]